jgi:hypothetical protein
LSHQRVTEELERRLADLRETHAYRSYGRARDAVLRMRAGPAQPPSAYWQEELRNVEYLLDASPLVIESLRRHCYHVTGVWPYNYRSHKDVERRQHEQRLRALIAAGGRDLLVPESPLLGGFGFEIDGALVNADTLRYYEALIALRLAGVLEAPKVVWEIGAGWGGFAYQLKTLFPDVTYVISDLPELFLFSATYLSTAFPNARLVFQGERERVPWGEADFVFVPHSDLEGISPPRIDLVVNMVSFQEMTDAQVSAYVDRAGELGAPRLYSLNRERSTYNPELSGVRRILERRYDVAEVDVLPARRARALRRRFQRTRGSPGGYVHLVGSLR